MNLTSESIKQRQQLCKELEGICREDYSVLETVIDANMGDLAISPSPA